MNKKKRTSNKKHRKNINRVKALQKISLKKAKKKTVISKPAKDENQVVEQDNKTAAKKAPVKKTTAKKAPAKKTAAKKTAAKKVPAKKTTAKK